MRAKAVHSTPTSRRILDQHDTRRTDTGAGGYGDSENGAPSIKHMSKSPPVYFTTTLMLAGFCGGCNVTTTTSLRHGLTLALHHTPGEQRPPSIGSHERRCGQAPQLQAINEMRKTQKGMEPVIS